MPTESRVLQLLSRDFHSNLKLQQRGSHGLLFTGVIQTGMCLIAGGTGMGIVVWGGCPLAATLSMLIHVTKRKLSWKSYPCRDSFLKYQGSSHPADQAVCLLPYARGV